MSKRRKTGEMPPWDDTPSTSGDTEDVTVGFMKVITKVGDALADDGDVRKLGIELRVDMSDIKRALETNWTGSGKTSDGNVLMLQNWAKKVNQSERLSTLRAALLESELRETEETCLPKEASTTSGQYEVYMDNSLSDGDTKYGIGPGYVLFVNNFFTGEPGLRKGAKADELNIKYLLEYTLKGYYLEYKKDVSLSDLQGYLKATKRVLATGQYKNFIFILGTHRPSAEQLGKVDKDSKDPVLMADNKWLLVEDIVGEFHGDQIPAMKDKPKVFIIQSCRGEGEQRSVNSIDILPTASNLETKKPTLRPVNSDILIAYASSEGTPAWRNEVKGSWFVEELCRVITEYHDKEHIIDMLVRVHGLMVKREATQQRGKQMPCLVCTLTRQFWLAPKK